MDSRTVEGYALVFGKQSRDLGGFTEVIEPTALEGILEKSDILCLLNHNEDRGILARSKYGTGSLELTIDDTGLKYRFQDCLPESSGNSAHLQSCNILIM